MPKIDLEYDKAPRAGAAHAVWLVVMMFIVACQQEE